ncbi:hypothetical protein Noc_0287 [Nitrosococcus oceani ATCC 19707]|uniref:Uncharacterized protein n=2 Tax=Nitrosococcus oceani TaxID=1229 RepID=Q3JED0_NITOC|nr:hypothetical protein [Nitrosococcus oceani]ABA56816.1 hypothetical protein Noc_0287 [Nitrosococcus oceani ATCC 19707]EDZ66568.1 hypothetical protein NOC27_3248 [Nitrosococcus oceani AFC27]KFI20769.1 hypothetical protein IB75_01470 [Nitrosococcus oceani C-27]GEM20573.1 hypothetical protein NONS58_19920 [Nitrosococcus oceani]
MNHSRLFEELLLELQILINSNDEYDLIKSSRVLRQLLLDGDALLHLVNRELRVSPQFLARNITQPLEDFFEPEIYPQNATDETVQLSLKNFLSFTIGNTEGNQISVRDIIKYGAIVLGGVHFKEDPKGEYANIARLHNEREPTAFSQVLLALRNIGAIVRDELIPIRNQLLMRKRFESGIGWTALLSLRLLPVPADEENYILDIGTREKLNRFSIFVDTREELTFRVVDKKGERRYLRAGRVGEAIPLERPITILCELNTLGSDTLLTIRAGSWDHAEIVQGKFLDQIGKPFHFVIGSDCTGRKSTHMDIFGTLVISRILSDFETSQAVSHFVPKARVATHYANFSGNQFLYSTGHPNFAHEDTKHNKLDV